MKKLALVLSMLVLTCGCGSNQPSSASLIAVTITPAYPASIDQGQTLRFTASLTNDTGNKGGGGAFPVRDAAAPHAEPCPALPPPR